MPSRYAHAYANIDVDFDSATIRSYSAFNRTFADFPLDLTVPQLVRDQARRTPDAIAVVDQLRQVSYRDLDEQADRVAAALHCAGCPLQGIVMVVADRNADFIATVLGILRAGAVYLPLDPCLPPARKQQVLDGSRPDIVVADGTAFREMRDLACAQPGTVVIEAHTLSQPQGLDFREPEVDSDDAAYVIYTSGSTGTPKGATVHHRGLANHLWLKVADLGMTAEDRLAQNAPQTFDIAVWQMLAPLLVGGSVQVVGEGAANDPTGLADVVADGKITLLELVPSMLRVVVDVHADDPDNPFAGLRAMVVGGEELLPQLARDWFALNPAVPLVNVYGPTECSDDVSHCRYLQAPDDEVSHMPIGTPVANTQLWVVAAGESGRFRLCRPGEQGEIWVTGTGVGLGYLNDPERTAQSFSTDPFHGEGRLYRTGDLGVIGPDGQLTYLGRMDRQVKVRGHRIELSEIESVLAQHSDIAGVAVDVRKRPTGRRTVARERILDSADPGGEKILVAYVVTGADERAVRAWVAQKLPAYMVPDKVIALSELPLTRNGKTDYRSLPDPGTSRPALGTPFTPAQGEVETAITELWSQTLGISPVGRDDAFTDLGGESLVAMVVASRLNKSYGAALSAPDVLRRSTPRSLARLVHQQRGSATAGGEGFTAFDRATDRYPLSVHQRGVWFQCELAPGNAYYNYQGSWSLRGQVDLPALTQAWYRLLTAHPVLLGRFAEEDGSPYLQYPVHAPGQVDCIDLSDLPPTDALARFRSEALVEVQRPIDLRGDLLVRAQVYRLAPDHHELLMTTHEILMDGWAASVLTAELRRHYEDVRNGVPAQAAPAPGADDFSRFLAWEEREVRRDVLVDQRAHWQELLAGELPVLQLPTDRPRPAMPTFRGEICDAVLAGDLLDDLREVGRRHGVTLFTTLLATYGVILGRYSGQDEVIIGVPMANRHAEELHGTIGFLINMLPVRLRLDWDTTGAAYLEQVGAQVAEALANCEYPFPWMLQDAAVERSTSVSPVFQTMFNMLNYPDTSPEVVELGIEFNELETGYTKYDMSLYAQPGPGGDVYLQIAYHTDLFERETVQRMLDGLLAACAGLSHDDTLTLDDVPVMGNAQLSMVLNTGRLD